MGSNLFAWQQTPASGPRIWLDSGQSVPVKHSGAPNVAQSLAAGNGSPLSMAAGDFDEDGVPDLLAGYTTPAGFGISLQRGNLDALAPQSDASFNAIGRGQFPSPFLAKARVIASPVRPDFLAAGNFTGQGHLDFVVAAKGGSVLYLFAGTGKGTFAGPQAINLNGGVTALASGSFGNTQLFSNLLVGLAGLQNTFSLAVFSGSPQGLAVINTYSVNAAVSSINFGDFGGIGMDAAFLAGDQTMLLHGSSMQLEDLALPVSAKALVVGSFLDDRNPGAQMALLTSDGSLQIAVHNQFDPRAYTVAEMEAVKASTLRGRASPLIPVRTASTQGWKIVENIASVAPFNPGQVPVMFRTRISSNGSDDVMVLNASAGQMAVVSHPNVQPGATTFAQGVVSLRPYAGSPVTALPVHVNIDGRPGVVALHQGQVAPSVLMPLPDPTFFVNRTDDPTPTSPISNACNNVSSADTSSSCSLREAVLKANSIVGTDTIQVPAGTITLALPRVANDFTGNHGTLEVTDSVNIVGQVDGSGNPASIIQAGTSTATGVDKIFSFNQDIAAFTTASVSLSNLVLRFGHNRGNTTIQDGWGGAFDFDTGGTTAGTGTATVTVTNCLITDNTLTEGEGGGIAIFNTNGGPGGITVTNSTIQNNVTQPSGTGTAGNGGGFFVAVTGNLVLNNTKVLNNSANTSGTTAPVGGGLELLGQVGITGHVGIHGSTISGNHAGGQGGGIFNNSNLVVDTGSIISNNTSGTQGAGLFQDSTAPDTATLSKVTITGNTATGNGGGIFVGNLSTTDTLSIQFSRLAGNSAPAGNNLDNVHSTVSATNNWWGTNTPAATINTVSSGATTFDPFIVLTHTASPAKIRINQSTTLTADMSKDNHGNGAALSGNLTQIIGLPITFNNAVDGSISGAQTAIQSNATATATFNAGNVAGGGKADAVVDQATVTANIIVLQPPSITKSFNPTTVAVNASSTITFSINNPNVVTINSSFTDTLPTGMVVASTPNVVNGCGGSVTAAAGSNAVSFSNAALPLGACTVKVDVSATPDNLYSNSVTIDSTDAGNGNTSSANLTVINPPTIAKAFGAATIPLNGTTSLTFTVSSTNANLTLNGVAFTDNLPSGLVVATPGLLSSTCSGTATAADGSSSISLSGASLAPGTTCTVSVNVAGTTAGVKTNSVQVTSTNGGTGNTSTASLTVVAPPAISKAFGAASIPLNGTTSLTFTITNPNTATTLTGIAFSDTVPAKLTMIGFGSAGDTCNGVTSPGSSTVNYSAISLAANSSCTLTVTVKGTAAGDAPNTTSAITSTEGGTGATSNTAVLTVVAPPSIAKAFNPVTIALNATTSLTFTITNPAANTVALTGVAFSDTLPTGLTVANASTAACGGTLTTTAPTGITLTGATIAVNSQCQFSVTVTGAASGNYTNTTGNVTSTNGGTGNVASANLTVAAPPSITKAFGSSTIALNASTSLTFTIQNPVGNVTLTGIAFTDSLPAGLVVAATPGATNNCSGTVTAVSGSGSVSLTGGTLAANTSCTVSVNVTGTTAGLKTNSVQVTSTEGGTGNTSTASITVVGPATISKSFNPTSVALNASSTLSFSITNPNTASALSGVAFTDSLPAGVVVSATPNVTGSCGSGTITAVAGSGSISLSGGTLTASPAAGSSCTFSVSVTGTSAGDKSNTTGAVTSTEGGTGATSNTAVLTVVAPPSIAKAFNPVTIALNATTSLTFTITNPAANTAALTGVAFSDTLPTGLTVANASTAACGGTLTTTAPTGITLTGATIAVNSQCQFSVTVTGAASGNYTNTTGNVTSTNGGTGNTATANLSVATPPTISKVFGAPTVPLNGSTSLTFTVTNPAANTISLTGVAFTDNLPSGLIVATPNGLNNTCGGVATAAGGSGSVSLSGVTLASNTSCTLSVNVTGTTAGAKINTVTATATESGPGTPATATLTVVGPAFLSKTFGAASIPLGGTTSLSFTVQNNNTTQSLSGIAFSDTLPSGLVISSPNGFTGSCGGGTITANAGGNTITLAGATLAQSTSCTFAVNVNGTTAGTQINTTGSITSTEGGTGSPATASINVVAPPSIAKVFNPANIALNATTSLTFTITNPAANAVSLAGVAFTDTLPTGLTVANSTATVCGGTLTTTAPTGIALSGATIAASGQCQFSVTVTGASPGSFTNTTGTVSSTNGGSGNTASANLTVATPPTITKAFGASSILVNNSTSLSFHITNPNTTLALTGLAFTDSLPAGLQVSTPNALTSTCGGATTATAGSGSVSLVGGTLAANTSCDIALNVTGVTAGVQINTTGVISSTESGAGLTSNSATLTVIGPPSILKTFGASSINLNATTTLNFTITNPNPTVALAGVAFNDPLPAGLVIATPSGLTGSCGSSPVLGASSISLSGGSIAAGGSCTFTVNVTGQTGGHKVNTTSTVTTSNAGTGNQSTATIDVLAPDLTITKTHTGTIHRGQTGAQYAITVSNVGFGPTTGTVTVVDTLPNVTNPPVATAISGTGWSCTLATLTCTRADALPSGSSYPVITLTVNIPQNIQNNFTNKATVSGGGDVNPNNNTASDPVSLGPPIVITPHSSTDTVKAGSSGQVQFDVEIDDPALGMVAFGCSGLPVGSSCAFNPPATNQPLSTVTMTISTLSHGVSASRQAPFGNRTQFYAALFFPVFGLVSIAFGSRRNKKIKMRLTMLLMGLVLLLSFVGCGGGAHTLTTPAGSFQVTVTAASTTVQANTQITLTVQ